MFSAQTTLTKQLPILLQKRLGRLSVLLVLLLLQVLAVSRFLRVRSYRKGGDMDSTKTRNGTFCSTISLLTCAAAAETVHDTTILLQYCLNGRAYNKSGTNADQTTPTTDVNTGLAFPPLGASQGALVVWGYTADGTVKCAMGGIESLDTISNLFIKTPQFPSIPETICPFAYQVLKVASTGSNIVFGVSNWNATGFTNAVVDIFMMPAKGQVS
jgi:hypothetical protein